MNIGLHNKLLAEKFRKLSLYIDERGKYLNKKTCDKNKYDHRENFILATKYEAIAKLQKKYLSHWICKDLVLIS
jgi:hypothetical protein